MALQHFYEGKTLLITGCTGLVGKVLLEKILRTLPNVHRVFVLIRAADSQSAKSRLLNRVLSCKLFDPLRNIHADGFQSFVEDKVVAVAGDVSLDESLGVEDWIVSEMKNTVEVIVHCAASTKFDEAYDVSLATNTRGALHLLELARTCKHLQLLLHVSTAYVCGDITTGVVKEVTPQFQPQGQECANNISQIQSEFCLLQETIRGLPHDFTEKQKTVVLRKFGMLRNVSAKQLGWPNTYTMTKAMAEMLLTHHRGDIPLVIIRPAIVESTLREPFPGWTEGNRTLNSVIIPYAKGLGNFFPGDPNAILDLIPADYVVNVILTAVFAHCGENTLKIYHVSSSLENPLFFRVVMENAYKYLKEHPWVNRRGKAVIVRKPSLLTLERFLTKLKMSKGILLQGFKVLNTFACNAWGNTYRELQKIYGKAKFMAALYEPYTFCKARFESKGVQELVTRLCEEDKTAFSFQVKDIQWEFYLGKIQFPGLANHVLNN